MTENKKTATIRKASSPRKSPVKKKHSPGSAKKKQKKKKTPASPSLKVQRSSTKSEFVPSKRTRSRIKSNPDRVRVIPLGGVEEVGRNMIVIEVGHDIIISDMGFEFTSDQSVPGIDYILPNTSYLEARKKRIRGVIITHGHLDHIGGIPFIMDRIGNPPIYTRRLTAKLIAKRQTEFPGKPDLNIRVIQETDRFKLGDTWVDTFPVTHSIPESIGIKIETPQGNIVISGDLKLDHRDGIPSEEEEETFGRLGEQDNLLFIADSTNAERGGFSITEREVQENLANIVKQAEGRLIIGTFASQLSRIISILEAAREMKKRVVLEGRSICNNIDIAYETGLFQMPKSLIIDSSEISKYPEEDIVIIATGAQGEEYAALRRIAEGKHRDIKLTRRDKVVLSSSVIPGNERAVQTLKDLLYHSELEIVTYRTSDVHSTGHGNAGELLWINKKVNPKFFMPGYGFRSMTFAHAEAVIAGGFPRDRVCLAENGLVVDFVDGMMQVQKEKVNAEMMVVDGASIGGLASHVLRERTALAQGGILVVNLLVHKKKHNLLLTPSFSAVGFIDLEEAKPILHHLRRMVSHLWNPKHVSQGAKKYDQLKDHIYDRLMGYVAKETNKKPVIELIINEL